MKKLLASLLASMAVAAPAEAVTSFNGHLYEYVAGSFTWQQALTAAAGAAPIAGYTAHLATVTSQAEDDFVSDVLTTNELIWLAGTDEATDGVWLWAAGPEAGQIFFGPGAAPGSFENWNNGEPNNFGGSEDYLHTNWFGFDWNDADAFTVHGYVLEYSPDAIPEPATWTMLIAGFGLAGMALRRRRRLALA